MESPTKSESVKENVIREEQRCGARWKLREGGTWERCGKDNFFSDGGWNMQHVIDPVDTDGTGARYGKDGWEKHEGIHFFSDRGWEKNDNDGKKNDSIRFFSDGGWDKHANDQNKDGSISSAAKVECGFASMLLINPAVPPEPMNGLLLGSVMNIIQEMDAEKK